jgi:hypothetical protein
MDDITFETTETNHARRTRRSIGGWFLIVFDRTMDTLEEDWAIVRQQSDLFLGALLFLLGLLDFHSGKYCDGNTADYLSCTRPVTYYYYTWLEIILIILGVILILLWFMKRGSHHHH